jgi:hypothetical protein
MKSPPDAATAEKNLCELLDAIEARLLHLRRERDELRETLDQVRRQLGIQLSTPPQSRRAKLPRNVGKPRHLPVETQALNQTELPNQPKPRKTRQALGRTLSQTRLRESGQSALKT